MDPRRILLAISGGIAAYKTPELVRALRRAGHDVRCALTPEAERFVAPLSLQAVSGQTVRKDLFDPGEEGEIDHIGLADWADLHAEHWGARFSADDVASFTGRSS